MKYNEVVVGEFSGDVEKLKTICHHLKEFIDDYNQIPRLKYAIKEKHLFEEVENLGKAIDGLEKIIRKVRDA